MPQVLTREAVLALAPDAAAASAGLKLAKPGIWRNLGQDNAALWGECQGSTLYHVKVDRASHSVACSCPSRKFPCKHGLGLLLLAALDPPSLPTSAPPEWVAAWLAKRAQAQTTKMDKPPTITSTIPGVKRDSKKLAKARQGIAALDLWLADLIRNGLAAVETQSAPFWENQAKRLVDAQTPGLATRVRRLGAIVGASPVWPERLLGDMGKLALLTQAVARLDDLEPALRDEVTALLGWTLTQDEVTERGEVVSDEWLILGQWDDDSDDRVLAQRSWCYGLRSHRSALVLQFSVFGRQLPQMIAPGHAFHGDLRFWPGTAPVRARIDSGLEDAFPLQGVLPDFTTVTEFLANMAHSLARQPWQDRFLCRLHAVVPICDAGGARWLVRDAAGLALPLDGGQHWRLLALSGGNPIDFVGEWHGAALLPLSCSVGGTFYRLWGVS